MRMQAATRSGQLNRFLELICLLQVTGSLEAVAEVRELLSRKYEECFKCGKTGHLARDCEVVQKRTRYGKVGHNNTNCVS